MVNNAARHGGMSLALALLIAAAAGCSPHVYGLSLKVYTAERPVAEMLPEAAGQASALPCEVNAGQAHLYRLTRYQFSRLNALARLGNNGVAAPAVYEADLRSNERREVSLELAGGARFQASIEIDPEGCCGLALQRTALRTTGPGGASGVTFGCSVPVAQLVLAELPPADATGRWTWVFIDAYLAEATPGKR